jgi:hypothetical protein
VQAAIFFGLAYYSGLFNQIKVLKMSFQLLRLAQAFLDLAITG